MTIRTKRLYYEILEKYNFSHQNYFKKPDLKFQGDYFLISGWM